MNVTLSESEINIIIQCIQQLNFSGKDVRDVGLLMDKLIITAKKIEEKNKKE